jgi:hypothetical protein
VSPLPRHAIRHVIISTATTPLIPPQPRRHFHRNHARHHCRVTRIRHVIISTTTTSPRHFHRHRPTIVSTTHHVTISTAYVITSTAYVIIFTATATPPGGKKEGRVGGRKEGKERKEGRKGRKEGR